MPTPQTSSRTRTPRAEEACWYCPDCGQRRGDCGRTSSAVFWCETCLPAAANELFSHRPNPSWWVNDIYPRRPNPLAITAPRALIEHEHEAEPPADALPPIAATHPSQAVLDAAGIKPWRWYAPGPGWWLAKDPDPGAAPVRHLATWVLVRRYAAGKPRILARHRIWRFAAQSVLQDTPKPGPKASPIERLQHDPIGASRRIDIGRTGTAEILGDRMYTEAGKPIPPGGVTLPSGERAKINVRVGDKFPAAVEAAALRILKRPEVQNLLRAGRAAHPAAYDTGANKVGGTKAYDEVDAAIRAALQRPSIDAAIDGLKKAAGKIFLERVMPHRRRVALARDYRAAGWKTALALWTRDRPNITHPVAHLAELVVALEEALAGREPVPRPWLPLVLLPAATAAGRASWRAKDARRTARALQRRAGGLRVGSAAKRPNVPAARLLDRLSQWFLSSASSGLDPEEFIGRKQRKGGVSGADKRTATQRRDDEKKTGVIDERARFEQAAMRAGQVIATRPDVKVIARAWADRSMIPVDYLRGDHVIELPSARGRWAITGGAGVGYVPPPGYHPRTDYVLTRTSGDRAISWVVSAEGAILGRRLSTGGGPARKILSKTITPSIEKAAIRIIGRPHAEIVPFIYGPREFYEAAKRISSYESVPAGGMRFDRDPDGIELGLDLRPFDPEQDVRTVFDGGMASDPALKATRIALVVPSEGPPFFVETRTIPGRVSHAPNTLPGGTVEVFFPDVTKSVKGKPRRVPLPRITRTGFIEVMREVDLGSLRPSKWRETTKRIVPLSISGPVTRRAIEELELIRENPAAGRDPGIRWYARGDWIVQIVSERGRGGCAKESWRTKITKRDRRLLFGCPKQLGTPAKEAKAPKAARKPAAPRGRPKKRPVSSQAAPAVDGNLPSEGGVSPATVRQLVSGAGQWFEAAIRTATADEIAIAIRVATGNDARVAELEQRLAAHPEAARINPEYEEIITPVVRREMLAAARARIPDADEAALLDVAQQAEIDVWMWIREHGAPERPAAFAATIARRRAIDYARGRGRLRVTGSTSTSRAEAGGRRPVIHTNAQERFLDRRRAGKGRLAQIREHERVKAQASRWLDDLLASKRTETPAVKQRNAIIRMTVLDELTPTEISERLGVSQQTVKSVRGRFRQKARRKGVPWLTRGNPGFELLVLTNPGRTLGDVAVVRARYPDADFWLDRASGRIAEYSAEHIGIKVRSAWREELPPEQLKGLMHEAANRRLWDGAGEARRGGKVRITTLRTVQLRLLRAGQERARRNPDEGEIWYLHEFEGADGLPAFRGPAFYGPARSLPALIGWAGEHIEPGSLFWIAHDRDFRRPIGYLIRDARGAPHWRLWSGSSDGGYAPAPRNRLRENPEYSGRPSFRPDECDPGHHLHQCGHCGQMWSCFDPDDPRCAYRMRYCPKCAAIAAAHQERGRQGVSPPQQGRKNPAGPPPGGPGAGEVWYMQEIAGEGGLPTFRGPFRYGPSLSLATLIEWASENIEPGSTLWIAHDRDMRRPIGALIRDAQGESHYEMWTGPTDGVPAGAAPAPHDLIPKYPPVSRIRPEMVEQAERLLRRINSARQSTEQAARALLAPLDRMALKAWTTPNLRNLLVDSSIPEIKSADSPTLWEIAEAVERVHDVGPKGRWCGTSAWWNAYVMGWAKDWPGVYASLIPKTLRREMQCPRCATVWHKMDSKPEGRRGKENEPACLWCEEEMLERFYSAPRDPIRDNPAAEVNKKDAKAYKDFHGVAPAETLVFPDPAPMPEGLVSLGQLHHIGYKPPDHSQKRGVPFRHVFGEDKDGMRAHPVLPYLATNAEGTQLYIVGGEYEVKPEGIIG